MELVVLGLVCVGLSVLVEILLGTWFRRLFDWSYPPSYGPYSQRWVTTKCARVSLAIGVLFIFVGLVAQRA